ncbi:UNVERIFIED_ORG: tetratricopeptide repeat protein [Burkholderia sp. CF145]
MKPRAFIGSSVEGLTVAYAVQQNLVHQVETTVWDQGIFNLSSTTIESLTAILNQVDFGIFVFGPDDIVKVRGEISPAVRDNVLFEMGLFIGKLGRERVFFIMPANSDIRVPTDLLGVTPGTFDAGRQDGSMQAGTGPVCHQIRMQIEKLGLSNPEKELTGEPEKQPAQNEPSESWFYHFYTDNFEVAKNKLAAEIEKAEESKKNGLRAWLLYIDVKKDRERGFGDLLKFANDNPTDAGVQALTMSFLTWENHYADAINLHSKLNKDVAADPRVVKALAECHIASAHPQDAIGVLTNQKDAENPEYALIVAGIHQEDGKIDEAMDILHKALEFHPSHERMRYRFASLAMEKEKWEISLYVFSGLKFDFPKNSDYWGYFGNCCLALDLYDLALSAYKHADELTKGEASWIAGNIGNLLSNKGLPTEAIAHLKRATKLDDSSQYAYDRMAGALKKKEEEDKLSQKKKLEGKLLFQNYRTDREKSKENSTGLAHGLATLLLAGSAISKPTQ